VRLGTPIEIPRTQSGWVIKKLSGDPCMSRTMSRTKRLRPLAGLVAMGFAAPAFAGQSAPFPSYNAGPQADGSFVVSTGQVITPTGTQVDLGDRVRAKAIAVNPSANSQTAAILTMGATQAVEVFNRKTGEVLQNYLPFGDSSGSYGGITYSADGKFLIFSQDSSNIAIAHVSPQGLLTDYAHIAVKPDSSFIKCFPNSPIGDYGRACGTFYSTSTSYPGGVAFSKDGKSAYALLNQNNTLTKIDLTAKPLKEGTQIRVGNAPHSVLINPAGTLAYISNEGGRAATQADFQIYSAGTPIVANKINGSVTTGTVSIVNLAKMQVVGSIETGLHPTGMATFGDTLLVANTYSDTISVIDMATNKVSRTINLALPIHGPGQGPAYGAAPNAIAVDAGAGVAYVALYNANAVAVVDLSGGAAKAVLGMIPVAFAPDSVVLDKANNNLIVANDKGVGTRYSFETDHGVTGYNTHQDNGTVSIVPIPNKATLASLTAQVYQNNHWDLADNIAAAGGGSKSVAPVAIPAKIGDPSTIKHVFLIIRENRTYDQILGDVKAGNGDASLAVFGAKDTPNAHALVKRFPLFDNFYDPSRQSADGHQWIVEAMAPYADDIQSPDWVRSYPGGNAGDALAYHQRGFLFQEAVQHGLKVKIYGEYVENETFPDKTLGHPTWSQFYDDAKNFEAGKEATLKYQNAIHVESSVPVVSNNLIKNFPQFDLGIPDQFRVDLWVQDFNKDVKAGTVPALSILWVMDDHTGGPPSADAEQADNDLAVGRILDYISHSNVWDSSAVFIEEDDAQNGVDHIDGHRSPGYVVSPYAVQAGPTDHTYYTQVNMTRTIEQILGLPPMNQFDLVASPMTTAFVKGEPSKANFAPFTHLKNLVPLNQGVTAAAKPANAMEKAWRQAKTEMFEGKLTKPDSQDPDTLSHLNWYEATGFERPYPGEASVRPPSDFKDRMANVKPDADGDFDGDND
jgi:YVTN family beta-propeller protein